MGADIAEGHQSPAGSAYFEGANCQQLACLYNPSLGFYALGHEPILPGNPGWECKWSFWEGARVIHLTGATFRNSNNPTCGLGEPPIRYDSTCQAGMEGKKSIKET